MSTDNSDNLRHHAEAASGKNVNAADVPGERSQESRALPSAGDATPSRDDQAALEALIAESQREEREFGTEYDLRAEEPLAEGADIDASLTAGSEETPIGAADTSEETGEVRQAVLLSQDEIDEIDAASNANAGEPAAAGAVGAEPGATAPAAPLIEEEGPIDQASIDALIEEQGAEDALSAGSGEDGGGLDQAGVGSLVAQAAGDAAPAEPAGEAPAGSAQDDEDTLGALVATPGDEARGAQIVLGAEPPGDLLDQGSIDTLIEQAQGEETQDQETEQPAAKVGAAQEAAQGAAQEISAGEEGPPEVEIPPPPSRKPSAAGVYIRNNALKLFTSSIAVVISALGTFTFLYTHQERLADTESLTGLQVIDLARTMASAEKHIAAGEYREAMAELDKVLADTPPSPERLDAEILHLEAAYKGLTPSTPELKIDLLDDRLDEFVETAPDHPRAAEALRWKADLQVRVDIPFAARTVYERILADYPSAPHLDEVLLDAAKLALELDYASEAADYAQRLLEKHPGSPRAGEAKLVLGDAYAAQGELDAARGLYSRIARSQPGTRLGARAFARLGKLAMDQGNFDEAIQQLESRIETATTVEGNEEVYLLLARAYRATGRLEDARRTLNDLIDFFPENEFKPAVFVELCEVLDTTGKRLEALRLARQAAERYPNSPEVLQNEAELLSLTGDPLKAAEAMLKAARAGKKDPGILLAAARSYVAGEAWDDAQDTYERLIQEFPKASEALEGTIELAEVVYKSGRVSQAIQRLEDLALATQGEPRRLPIVMALGKMYGDLGLRERVAELYRELAANTSEPEVLGQAAAGLFEAGLWDQGFKVAKRVDIAKTSNKTAYALLMKQGEALLRVDPRRGIEMMAQACESYPDERADRDVQRLLEAYLATDNTARARALVMDLRAHVSKNPVDAPRLERAALAWADHLYEKGDFRAAADAYSIAIEADNGRSEDNPWAMYQRANALLELADFETSAMLYEEVAASDAPWAEDAGIKALYARLEQRMRGAAAKPKGGEGPPEASNT